MMNKPVRDIKKRNHEFTNWPIHEFKELHKGLLKLLFIGVLFFIYYFKKHFKPCFFIFQHFKFVNWSIRGFVFWCHELFAIAFTKLKQMSSATKLNLDVVWDLKFARLTGSNTNSETTNPETKNAQNNQISWQNSVILWAFDYYQQNWNSDRSREVRRKKCLSQNWPVDSWPWSHT